MSETPGVDGRPGDGRPDDGEGSPLPVEPEPATKATATSTPEQTRDDTDLGWGERPDEDAHDRWLQEQRPPHWE
ncbi:hypothetical protein ASG73_15060 [Janibacter sp. Soil728]|uniref:hypothetical protein n=1 Tax=Janibacter sp. Soil728 TaxID=1736393 RepID=UPI0006FCE6D7|nr:hypothetical protein [Janibacter sp. Soil728]KRE35981.1 hypothetical protein ASG73_15060 [Janibacter sp. Soil728]